MLAMRHRKAIAAGTRKRYAKAKKKGKTIILDQFIAITGYNRTYAGRILKLKAGKVIGYAVVGGKKIKYIYVVVQLLVITIISF
ncbi:MAG: hypothetical protein H8E13_00325 [Actinobacteria bacterium]|nr:hypothetical protein [Actinomycetota bacterium]